MNELLTSFGGRLELSRWRAVHQSSIAARRRLFLENQEIGAPAR
ncbi:MAG: hypothetical protein ACTHK7_06480 [Aureliella sp.]